MFLREVKINKLIDRSVEGNLNFLRFFYEEMHCSLGRVTAQILEIQGLVGVRRTARLGSESCSLVCHITNSPLS